MSTISATKAREKLYKLIDEVNDTHEPVEIRGRRGAAMLVSEEDWRAIQETMYLLSVPGMRDSIREGLESAVEDCDEKLDW